MNRRLFLRLAIGGAVAQVLPLPKPQKVEFVARKLTVKYTLADGQLCEDHMIIPMYGQEELIARFRYYLKTPPDASEATGTTQNTTP